eukprot:TRINITY_DN24655_c0_g1_i1.p1 TRINITY_DN24655_c0_g1~~TRINITY_DN24655_c0_g1_i1.p1  ORF type:complete len:313 (+),score=68.70 TRINITY_DN24655_c0_g1_i1:55-939(+)
MAPPSQWVWQLYKAKGPSCLAEVMARVRAGKAVGFWDTPAAPLLCMQLLLKSPTAHGSESVGVQQEQMRWVLQHAQAPPAWGHMEAMKVYNAALRWCAILGDLKEADWVLDMMVERKLLPNEWTYAELVKLYKNAPIDCVEQAMEVYAMMLAIQPMRQPDLVRSVANELTLMQNVGFDRAQAVFNSLPPEIPLNYSSFLSLLTACERDARAGGDAAATAARRAARITTHMRAQGLPPRLKHQAVAARVAAWGPAFESARDDALAATATPEERAVVQEAWARAAPPNAWPKAAAA